MLWMMKIGTMPKQGDILLIPIPFTDLSSKKRRPVIVISNDQYNRKTSDVIVFAMTTNPQVTDYSLSINSSDLVEGALNRPGKIRVDKVYTLSQTIVVRTFGQVDACPVLALRLVSASRSRSEARAGSVSLQARTLSPHTGASSRGGG
jgi:mRNA interferase MazF